MIQFTQDDFDQISAECIKGLSDRNRVSVPLEKYPDYRLCVEISPYDWLVAKVNFVTKDSSQQTVGAAMFDNQEPTADLVREAVEQGLNSFADTYNAIEKGEKPKQWPGFGSTLDEKIAVANAQGFLHDHIHGKSQPVRAQPVKAPEESAPPQEKKFRVPNIDFSQEDVNKMAERFFHQMKPRFVTGRAGNPRQDFKCHLKRDPNFFLEATITRTLGIKKTLFDMSVRITFKGQTIAAESQSMTGAPEQKDFRDLIQKTTDEFSAICNAIKKGEHVVKLPHLDGSKIANAELKRDLVSYILSGNPTPVTRPKSFNLER